MKKIAIIKRSTPPEWISCQSISSNLLSAWEQVENIVIETFHFDEDYRDYRIAKTAKSIKEFSPTIVVFIDHAPCPALLIEKVYQIYEGTDLPYLAIHVYGDFALQTPSWHNINDIFRKFRSIFFCASGVQKKFLSQFIKNDSCAYELPFPIDTDFFIPSDKENPTSNTTFLYTGRVTKQKNIYELIASFKKYKKLFDSEDLLKIVGPHDDMNTPYLGTISFPLSYSTQLQKSFDKDCYYCGSFTKHALRTLYQNSDFYINMSTYNDEDYGMAVIEALSCGTPGILTAWGGFHSFKKNLPKYVSLIPTMYNNDDTRILFSHKELIKKLVQSSPNHLTLEEKFDLHNNVKNIYSINSVSNQICSHLDSNHFHNYTFNDSLLNFASSFHNAPTHPFRAEVKYQYNNIYKQWYKCYQDEL